MKNWLDQDITIGTIVYRQADRYGSRIGKVVGFKTFSPGSASEQEKLTIQWCLGETGITHVRIDELVIPDLTWAWVVDKMEAQHRADVKRYKEIVAKHPDQEDNKYFLPQETWWREELTAS